MTRWNMQKTENDGEVYDVRGWPLMGRKPIKERRTEILPGRSYMHWVYTYLNELICALATDNCFSPSTRSAGSSSSATVSVHAIVGSRATADFSETSRPVGGLCSEGTMTWTTQTSYFWNSFRSPLLAVFVNRRFRYQ